MSRLIVLFFSTVSENIIYLSMVYVAFSSSPIVKQWCHFSQDSRFIEYFITLLTINSVVHLFSPVNESFNLCNFS